MELYMDEKWKLSKKGSRNGSRRGIAGEGGPFLKNSMSLKEGREMRRRSTATTTTTTARSFSSRCSSLAKEQRARFYIMRRCVTMLICWRDYA